MKKMLVVDDEAEICEFLKAFFEERNFDVATAHSGEEAVLAVEQGKPDVVLLDIHMPGMGGLNALRQIKEKYKRARVIMVTAIETNEKIDEAMRLGADNYITKPLSLEYLEREVQEKVASLSRKIS